MSQAMESPESAAGAAADHRIKDRIHQAGGMRAVILNVDPHDNAVAHRPNGELPLGARAQGYRGTLLLTRVLAQGLQGIPVMLRKAWISWSGSAVNSGSDRS